MGYILSGFVPWLFRSLDSLVSKFLGAEPLRKDKIGTVKIKLRRYRGHPVKLDDGCRVQTGAPVIELHLNNTWFLYKRRTTNFATVVGWEFASAFYDDLKYLAQQIMEGKWGDGIKAIYGVTLLHSWTRRLGFTVVELPNSLWEYLVRFYLYGLMQAYGFRREGKPATRVKPYIAREIWMSRHKLLRKYGSREPQACSRL